MALLAGRGEEWAVATLEEKLGPDGAAALGMVLGRIEENIRKDLREALSGVEQRLGARIDRLADRMDQRLAAQGWVQSIAVSLSALGVVAAVLLGIVKLLG